jgi:hypothetical protein
MGRQADRQEQVEALAIHLYFVTHHVKGNDDPPTSFWSPAQAMVEFGELPDTTQDKWVDYANSVALAIKL